MQIKTKIRYYLPPIRMEIIKRTNAGVDVEKSKPLLVGM